MCDIFPNSNFITPCWFLVAFYWTTPLVLVAHHFSNTKQWLEYITSLCLLIIWGSLLFINLWTTLEWNIPLMCKNIAPCSNGATMVHCSMHHCWWLAPVCTRNNAPGTTSLGGAVCGAPAIWHHLHMLPHLTFRSPHSERISPSDGLRQQQCRGLVVLLQSYV